MFEYCCIRFIEFMINGNSLIDYINLFFVPMNVKRIIK